MRAIFPEAGLSVKAVSLLRRGPQICICRVGLPFTFIFIDFRRARLRRRILFTLLLISILGPPRLLAQTSLTDLYYGTNDGLATSVNQSGQVVGYSLNGNASPPLIPAENFNSSDSPPTITDNNYGDQAFLYSSGTLTPIGYLNTNNPGTQANAINDSGEVVGGSQNGIAYGDEAYVYSSGSGLQGIQTGETSVSTSVNDAGVVVGFADNGLSSTPGGHSWQAFEYSPSAGISYLSSPYGNSYAYGINGAGQIVGSTSTNGGSLHAFVYSAASGMQDLGTLGGNNSTALSINSSGEMVGFSLTSTDSRSLGSTLYTAFAYQNGTMTNLGALNLGPNSNYNQSAAECVNDSGEVVGFSENIASSSLQAFLYTPSSGMENLNSLYSSLLVSGTTAQAGFVALENATSINDNGQIVGYGEYWTGTEDEVDGFLLDTPEPPVWLMLGFGILALKYVMRFPPLGRSQTFARVERGVR